jgi:hypothetical protein
MRIAESAINRLHCLADVWFYIALMQAKLMLVLCLGLAAAAGAGGIDPYPGTAGAVAAPGGGRSELHGRCGTDPAGSLCAVSRTRQGPGRVQPGDTGIADGRWRLRTDGFAGNSAESALIELVSGLNPREVMPIKGTKLSAEQVGILRAWIDQGVAWEPDFTFAKRPPLNLTPRWPDLPASAPGWEHPVDRLLRGHLESKDWRRHRWWMTGFCPPGLPGCDRGCRLRREDLTVFLADGRADKRQRLVDRFLADHRGYAEHWLSFWNDVLRNDYRGTGYIDGGRRSITGWLYRALLENKPYDRLVAELVDPTPESDGFIKGIVWRGEINSSQTPEMQAAQNVSQLFLGVNLKCASCHDSFIDDWSLADAYGLATVYAESPLEMFECDMPTGQTATPRFPYPQLGEIDANAPRAERQRQLAELLTGRPNGRVPRTMVNRLWQRLLGVGLVEPADEMEQPAWNPDLLDWLAEDLVAHGYDLKHTLRRILTSRAYQLPAVSVSEPPPPDYVFRGPAVRRLTAEQFRDALAVVTGVWYGKPAAQVVSSPEPGRTRASLVAADPLQTALGRPPREQMITTRPTTATTLQALELTNGDTLSRLLDRGAERMVGWPRLQPGSGPGGLRRR